MKNSPGRKLPPYFFFYTIAKKIKDAGKNGEDKNNPSNAFPNSQKRDSAAANMAMLARLESRAETLKSVLY